jgi:SNF2 family DNA or RNA helicase
MSEFEYSWPAREGLIPFKHQKETVYFLLQNKRAFVLNDMGTGKTLSVLWCADILFQHQKIKKVLIVCPLSTMRSVWQREIFLNFPMATVGIAHGPKDVRRHIIKQQYQYTVINHDGVKHMYNDLCAQQYDIIVIDELTAFKNLDSDRTKAMEKLAKTSRSVWGLTGKPTPNSPVEAFAQAHVVNPYNRNLPRFFQQFKSAVIYRPDPEKHPLLWVPTPGAEQLVASVLQPSIRYRINDCIDMPEMTTQTREIPFTPAQKVAYDDMLNKLYLELEAGEVTAANAAVKLNKLLQISAGAVRTDEGIGARIDCAPRLSALKEIYEETPQGKIIVFATFRETIDLVTEYLNAQGIETRKIYGDVSPRERDEIIQNFQHGSIKAIIIQPQSGAHGITLTAASTTIWFSLISSNELYQQGNARFYRPGQSRACSVIHFISSAAERHIANMLTRKEVSANAVLDLIKGHEL